MGRKNRRLDINGDSNFEKFMKTINGKGKDQNKNSFVPPKRTVGYIYERTPEVKPKMERPIMKESDLSREERNAQRLLYAENMLKQYAISYEVKDIETGRIICKRKCDKAAIEFKASNGYITGYNDFRGVHALIKLLLQEV